MGDVFRYDAKELFVEYASRCSDKEKVANIILKLNLKDECQVEDTLLICASRSACPDPVIKSMIKELQALADKEEEDEYKKRHHLMLIESLARQIKDAKLFEQARLLAEDIFMTA